MVVDWTGTNPQVKGAINNTLSFTKAASYTGVRSVLPPGIPNNEGVFRAIEVICPPGTIGNARAARRLRGSRAYRISHDRLHVRRARDDVARQGEGSGRRRQHGHVDRRLLSRPLAFHLRRLHLRRLGRAALGRRPRRQLAHVCEHGFAFGRGDRGRASHSAAGVRVRAGQGRRRANIAAAFRSGATTGFSKTRPCCKCAPTAARTGRSGCTAAARASPPRTI